MKKPTFSLEHITLKGLSACLQISGYCPPHSQKMLVQGRSLLLASNRVTVGKIQFPKGGVAKVGYAVKRVVAYTIEQ